MGGNTESRSLNQKGGGIASINGDITSAQTILGGTGITVSTTGGATTITATGAGTVTGTGTVNFFPLWSSSTALTNSKWKQGSNGEFQYQNFASAKGTSTVPIIDMDPGVGTGFYTDGSDNVYTASFGRPSFMVEPGGYTLYDGGGGTSVKMRSTISGYRTRVVGSGGIPGGPSTLEWAGDTTNGQGTSAIQISNAAGTLLALLSCDISTNVFSISGKTGVGLTLSAANPAVVGLPSLTASLPVFSDASKNLVSQTVAQTRTALNINADRSSFVYKPGGVASGNTYSSFATLYADLSLTSGSTTIFFDNTITDPIIIPPGSYPNINNNVTFRSNNINTPLPTEIQFNGVTLGDIPNLISVILTNTGSTPTVTLNDGLVHSYYTSNQSLLQSNGTAEFLRVDAGTLAITYLITGSSLENSGYEAINLLNNSTLIVYMEEVAECQDGFIRDDGTGNVLQFLASASAQPAITNSNFTGTISTNLGEDCQYIQTNLNSDSGSVAQSIASMQSQWDNPTVVATGTYTIPNNCAGANVHSLASLLTLTIKMPATPRDGQWIHVTLEKSVTTLTWNGNGGTFLIAPTASATAGKTFIWQAVLTSGSFVFWPKAIN